ncbi:tRNA (adenine(22)-N(1))-methyltransferase TrmK [Jeotgalibacillus sp. ET6]|uniref:tRNA (adenine(22)-N(1))-methyltransferase n=1 Tax=Jeotgalibacillus sp. ET6 TaxID=3037260 RepID=UPI0024185DE3|nr:tRNA (adenine(22)-N(1))-methyltransferase TrmK [Jeotgalibacillus sp. ET6]MDG5470835.1 tRNA (adenine(22)-N(1))-methyltransferase TrmK [Jeotgalibacillus sp. ET6]
MNSNQLSKRLTAVASFVPKGSVTADIGSDHAYLPCYLIHKKIAVSAIAGEVAEGPFQSALKQVEDDGLKQVINVRKGSGLSVLNIGEVDVVTIAGMGGPLISQILEDGKSKLPGVQRLILQPNISAISIRDWLTRNQWKLIAEEILEEDGKVYEILVAEPSERLIELTYADRLLGPFLAKENSAVFQQKWNEEYKQWERILRQLTQAEPSEIIEAKKEELREKMTIVKEALR